MFGLFFFNNNTNSMSHLSLLELIGVMLIPFILALLAVYIYIVLTKPFKEIGDILNNKLASSPQMNELNAAIIGLKEGVEKLALQDNLEQAITRLKEEIGKDATLGQSILNLDETIKGELSKSTDLTDVLKQLESAVTRLDSSTTKDSINAMQKEIEEIKKMLK
jgi:hypothetical protein